MGRSHARWYEIGKVSLLRCSLIIAGAAIAGCSAKQSAQRTPNPNRYIYVTAQNLPGQCYRDLGTLEFDEPFAEAAIDPDSSNAAKHIRALAVAKYPDDVDAIINLHPDDNDAGTTVRVSGEAVELEDHTTVECTLRGAPEILDASAAAAAVGIGGTVIGGLLGGSTAAMSAGGGSALAAGAGEILAHRADTEQQRQQVMKQLVDQRGEIRDLQSERARLKSCEDQEIPLSNCDFKQASQVKPAVTTVSAPTEYQELSLFELQKQAAEQHDYISQLKQQISGMEWEMINQPEGNTSR
jgi:hypothetical protein